jgi:hypothetical protein
MDPINSFSHVFDLYCKDQLPRELPPTVRVMFEKTFFAGAGAAMRAVDIILRTASTPAEGFDALQVLREEVSEHQAHEVEQILAALFKKHGLDVEVHAVQVKG